MKVIIAGSRDIALPFGKVALIVEASGYAITELVSGGCRGVDKSGEAWAAQNNIPTVIFSAEWEKYQGRAGPIRNSKMAVYAEALIAIPGTGSGTQDMIRKMKAINKPVFIWTEPEASNESQGSTEST